MSGMNGSGAPPPVDSVSGSAVANGAGPRPPSRSFAADRKRVAPEVGQQMDRAKIGAWALHECDPERKNFQCVQFTLVNKNADEPLQHFLIPKTTSHVERQALVEQLVDCFDDESREDAQGYPFKQTYRVHACLTADPHAEPYNSKTFVVMPPPEASEGFAERQGRSSSSGDIDPKAVIGDLQRLLDRRMALDDEKTLAILDRAMDAEQRARDREERIAADREKLWVERERLLNEQADREAKNYASRIEAHAYGQLVEGGLKYAGVFANAVMAQKFGGGQLATFAKTLEPEQVLGLLQMMNDTQRDAFQPIGMQISAAWPEDKRERLVALHAQLSAQKQLELETQQAASSAPPAPPNAPPPTTASTPASGDPEWRALGYLSEAEYLAHAAEIRAGAPTSPPVPATPTPAVRPCTAGHDSSETCVYCEPFSFQDKPTAQAATQSAKSDSQGAAPAEPARGTLPETAATLADPAPTTPAAKKTASKPKSKRKS